MRKVGVKNGDEPALILKMIEERKRLKMNIKDLVAHWDDINIETKIHINFKLTVRGYEHHASYNMCCLDILVSEHAICNIDLTENNIDYYFGINNNGAYIDVRVRG